MMPDDTHNGFPEGYALGIDASGLQVSVAGYVDGACVFCEKSSSEALDSVFRLARGALAALKVSVGQLDAVVYGEGPGSILGLRVAAVAVNTWAVLREDDGGRLPLFAFNALSTVAATRLAGDKQAPFTVLSDFRKERWTALTVAPDPCSKGAWSPISVVDAEAVRALSGGCFYLRQRKVWHEPPIPCTEVTFDIRQLPELAAQWPILRPVERAEPFVAEQPAFVKWTADRHRKPV